MDGALGLKVGPVSCQPSLWPLAPRPSPYLIYESMGLVCVCHTSMHTLPSFNH